MHALIFPSNTRFRVVVCICFSNQLSTKRYYEEIFESPIDDNHKAMPMESTMMAHAGRNCSRYGPHLYGGIGDGRYIGHLDGRGSMPSS